MKCLISGKETLGVHKDNDNEYSVSADYIDDLKNIIKFLKIEFMKLEPDMGLDQFIRLNLADFKKAVDDGKITESDITEYSNGQKDKRQS